MSKNSKVYSYNKLKELIEQSRSKQPKIGTNTTARFLYDKRIAIRLHYTDIIIVDENNNYQLFSGGWNTTTTRDRLNHYSPAYIKSVKGEMFIRKDFYEGTKKDNLIPFREGIFINSEGEVIPRIFQV